jgi:hypothetical protein
MPGIVASHLQVHALTLLSAVDITTNRDFRVNPLLVMAICLTFWHSSFNLDLS